MSSFPEVDTLTDLLMRAAEEWPEKPLIQFIDGPALSAPDLLGRASATAAVLQELGMTEGDRVAIVLENCEEFLWVYFGAVYGGGVAVPINVELRGPILEHVLRESEPKVVVVGPRQQGAVSDALARLSLAVQPQVMLADLEDPSLGLRAAVEVAGEGTYVPTDPATLAVILYTAGTTGPSKGILVCNRMSLSFPRAITAAMRYGPEDVLHNVLPLFHGNAINITLLPALGVGATAVFGRRFSASGWWDEVRSCDATAISLLGSMVPILWNQPISERDRDHSVRIALAVPAPVDEFEGFEKRFGLQLASLYGMTDCGLVILTPPEGGRPGYAGVSHPDWECSVVDENDVPLPDGEVGELILRPKRPYITQLGYWRNAEATVEAWRNLWFHTGDRMVRDPDGWFKFIDRKKDALRRFGENISSFEVESVIQSHPDVAEAAVFAVPAELEEDEVMAAVQLEQGASCTPDELFRYCEPLLPYFAVPRFIDIRTTLPKTPTEKVRKELLRAEGVTDTTWDHGPMGRRNRQAREERSRTHV